MIWPRGYHLIMRHFRPFDEATMPDDLLEAYLQLCQEVFLNMQRTGAWPWPDSQISDNLLESKH